VATSDTTGTLVLQTGATPTTALTLGSDQSATFAGAVSTTGYVNAPNTFGFKNRIINGNMAIDQRNAGASVTQSTSLQYVTDRFAVVGSVASKFTAQQSSTATTGFINSLLCTSSSAYTVGASEDFTIRQYIEGLNSSDLAWGSASAATVTLSFWVRSSLTGTFGGSIANSAQDRFYVFSYTVNAANTWEQKTITIAGDTSGIWLTTNGIGIRLLWSLGAGATISGTAGAWGSTFYRSATGATSVVGTNGATFYITGVQLEKGSVATSFDFRDYGRELLMCQRYYWKILQGTGQGGGYGIVGSGVTGNGVWQTYGLPVFMRATPTVTVYGTWAVSNTGQPTAVSASASNFTLQTIATATAAIGVYPNSSDDLIDASAEL
jgi:hypothetical protein